MDAQWYGLCPQIGGLLMGFDTAEGDGTVTENAAIRTVVVDDLKLIRQGLRLLLADEKVVEVVGEADNGLDAIAQVEQLQPDVVLMDIEMPTLNGVEATRRICDRFERVKVLILSVDDDEEYVAQALRHGAAGYLLKNTPADEIAFAIQAVHKGYMHLGPGIGQKVIAQLPDPALHAPQRWKKLTPREQEILQLIAQGANNREIAQRLCISEKTVKNHVSSILHRLDLRDRTQAAIFASNSKLAVNN